ncbi:MAG TPA: O-antigen ligase family protein [Blastocatellia bacterium]|nr:O-antigen ligase family protein [Blastocatellia bacterium]
MTMKKSPKRTAPTDEPGARARAAIFWLIVSLLVSVPLAFSTSVHRIYSVPKFALLVTLSAVMLPLVALVLLDRTRRRGFLQLRESKHVPIVALYFVTVLVSTLFGVAPVASLFGSVYNQMGLVTQVCFFICFLGLIAAVGRDRKRFERALWAMGITGAAVAVYACMQFFGFDPYLPQGFYTMSSVEGEVVRVISTIGHSNSLGNFLLYTAPISAGLAIASKGESRWLMAGATALSAAAVVFSGTRGAWLGLAAGGSTFAALMAGSRLTNPMRKPRRLILQTAAVLLVGLIAVWAMSFNPASRGILARARGVATEGFTGSGRTLLWRDSIRMVPSFALVGSGPEGFRKAFLAYKSRELARHAPQINNESSHNTYLDAAISFGLPGAIAYIAIIVSSLLLLARSRRRAESGKLKALFTGLISALVAVVVHNIFIYDQISTGLYFFATAALAFLSTRVAGGEESGEKADSPRRSPWAARAILAAGGLLAIAAAWHSIALIRADAAMANAFASANLGDFDRSVKEGNKATTVFDPAGDYDLLFARALARCADRMQSDDRLKVERAGIIDLGMIHAERSLRHTLTPDASHLVLAHLAQSANDPARLRSNAEEAIRWDPNYASARRLLAESYLAEGDRDRAAREAELALDINPLARDARALLKRMRNGFKTPSPLVEERIARGRALASRGKLDKARRVLRKAISQSGGPCPDCHRALASVYEADGRYNDALDEWQRFIEQKPEGEAADQARRQVEALKQKIAVK